MGTRSVYSSCTRSSFYCQVWNSDIYLVCWDGKFKILDFMVYQSKMPVWWRFLWYKILLISYDETIESFRNTCRREQSKIVLHCLVHLVIISYESIPGKLLMLLIIFTMRVLFIGKDCKITLLAVYIFVLFRDIKGKNVMLDKYGNIKLIDFGCAIRLKENPNTNVIHQGLKSMIGRLKIASVLFYLF